ncbi:D-serine deaminase-like pyridoxal phosphate-dependent protein [Aurantimicrobium minutum]|uniref:alanine racemase n=1 Tax=Aurantimicrobium minutum TaxID=708131 RepID=UPI002473AB2E|nr:alanine racemase [Aurantimicrobium minutum]MDH6533306.1 D-serine deaminase-like pyridoxal phosphate-dependent protein [Aurantimicrobium minutum]
MFVTMPETPFIAIELGVLQNNIARAAEAARTAGIALRPHVKTHKMIEIARMQEAAGILGITVATLGEAEVFVAAGFADVLIAYPLWLTDASAQRLSTLLDQATIRLGIDSAESAERYVRFLGGKVSLIEFLIEVDCGHHRSGVAPGAVGELAEGLRDLGLDVSGCFTFPGHSYALEGRAAAAHDEAKALATAQHQLVAAGFPDAHIRSGGSTPSLAEADVLVVTEQRPGVYVFNDAQQVELGSCNWSDIALTVHATVVSVRGNKVIVNAGSKALGADRAPYASGYGRILNFPDARMVALSEHHATVDFADAAAVPALGEILKVVPNHVCNTVNLADEAFVFDRGELVDCWKVAARGKNS